MQELYELKEKLMNELTEYAKKKEMSSGSLDVIDKMAHALKNLNKVIEDCEEGGYSSEGSYRGMSNRSYMYSRDGGSYDDGSYNSYARGRGRGARRDAMGRYSRDGYSGKSDMVEDLREILQETTDTRQRKELQEFIQKMEQM